jgi:antitoxin Phd
MASKSPKRREPYKQELSSQPSQLQAARAQFGEVFRRARERAPQVVTKQGKEAVVILAMEGFERLTKRSISKFFAESPLARVPIDLERTPD